MFLRGTQYGATGTPTFFIGNEKDGFMKLVGAQPFNSFKLQIDSPIRIKFHFIVLIDLRSVSEIFLK